MTFNRTSILALAAAAAVFAGCATTGGHSPLQRADLKAAEELIRKIEAANASLPSSFTAKIAVNATVNGRVFKTGGTASFIKEPRAIKVLLQEQIFRTVFADMLYRDDLLKIYVPIDKTLYIREKNQVETGAASLELNPEFVSLTALGRIPLISGYTVTKSYTSEGNNPAEQVIVIENDSYYESIALRNGLTEKVRILAKKGGDKFEAHFEKPVEDASFVFYQKISAFSENSSNRFELSYSKMAFNAPIDAKTFIINVPEGTKTVK